VAPDILFLIEELLSWVGASFLSPIVSGEAVVIEVIANRASYRFGK